MKKVFNFFGVILSFILMIFLSLVITFSAVILNITSFTKESTINKVLVDIDLTDTIKLIDDGKVWKGLVKIANTHGYTEENATELINNKNLKEFVSMYLSDTIDTIIYGNELNVFTCEQLVDVISETIDDYNKNTDNDISNKTKAEILDFVEGNYEHIKNILPTEENINEILENENELSRVIDIYVTITSNKMLGFIICLIIFILILIALLRFSYYKWSFYASFSLIFSSIFLFMLDYLLVIINVNDFIAEENLINNIIISLIKNATNNLFITAFILLVIAIFVFVLHHYFKQSVHIDKNFKNNKSKENENIKTIEKEESEL